jgi:hypothetical protein
VSPFSPERLIAFAEARLSPLLGPSFPPIFLAGGAFKTLLHGRPPRDLDLWAETPEARRQLLATLLERGASRLPAAPGAERFLAGDQLVEVSFQIEAMEERLARFDLGLSCCAVVWRDGRPGTLVHPLALASIRARQILLIDLAADLGYEVPAALEQQLWSTFLAQPPALRRELIDKLRVHYGEHTFHVATEAEAHG